MLAIGFFVFVARYFVPADAGAERAMRCSFSGLNGGLAWMVVANLFPVGALQFYDALEHGYWHARSPAFYAQPIVRARMGPHRKRPGAIGAGETTESLTHHRA